MSNTWVTPTIIAKSAVRSLYNQMPMARLVNRQYDSEWKGVKPGQSITIRKPNKFLATKSRTIASQDITQGSLTLTVSTQLHTAFKWTSVEKAQSLTRLVEDTINPAMNVIANTIEVDLLSLYKDVYNQVGSAGTTPGTFAEISPVARRLDEEGCPKNDRHLILGPAAYWNLPVDTVALNFPVAGKTFTDGIIPRIAGLQVHESQNVQTHTVGAHAGTPVVDGATQTGAALATDGWNASISALLDGDIFTIAGVNAVNPVSQASTGVSRQFVVTADVDTGASTATDVELAISPSLTYSTAFATIDGAPADDAAITVAGTLSTAYPINLAFQKNGICLAMVPLEKPDGAAWSEQETYKGISARIVKDYDIEDDEEVVRVDVLYGVVVLDPALCCRLIG